MQLNEILTQDRIFILSEKFEKKEEVIRLLFERSLDSSFNKKSRDTIFETLMEREQSMSTGIGLGVAIPHCSTELVTEVFAVIGVLKNGIDFQSVDDIPVRIVALLILPKNKFEKHIKTLASLARFFNEEHLRKKILDSKTPEEIFQIVIEESANIKEN